MSKLNEAKRPRGNQTKYTSELAQYICDEMAKGRSVRDVCREPGMPDQSTVNCWVIDDREGFASQYARARLAQMAMMETDLLEIVDQPPPTTESGASDSGWVAHQRLQVDTRKWLMSKIAPKKYGDKLDLQHTGSDGNPIEIRQITRVIIDPKTQ